MPWSQKQPNGRHRAFWRDNEGKIRSRAGFTRAAEAERFAGEQESRARRGESSYVGRSATWGEWCQRWLELRRVERTTDTSDQTRIDRWLKPRWEPVQLVRITAEDVQVWVNELDDLMAPASVEKVYYLFSASMKAAVKHKRLAASPCQDIELPTVPPPDERFLTWDEFWAAAHLLTEPYRTAAIILVGTGMRFGEMAGLHQHRIHWDSMTIDVHETWDGERIKAYPKGRNKRRVPLPSWVAEAIREHRHAPGRTCGLTHSRGNGCRSELVLRGPQGAPLNARNMLRRHWAPALARAGLDHARQHDLRHTYASWLVQAGRPLAEIAEVLGQTDVAVARRYAHLAGTHLDAVRAVLEGPHAAESNAHGLLLTALAARQIAAGQQPGATSLLHDLDSRRRMKAL